MKIAFLGLGTMGGAMAGHIQKAGHDLRVFNRTPSRAETWSACHGGPVCATVREAVEDAGAVFLCLADDRATGEVATAPGGLLDSMAAGAYLVDHGSGSPEFARHLAAQFAQRGITFFDAPVTGGGRAAREGHLTIMAGAPVETLQILHPVMRSYAQEIASMGAVGAGHLTKLVNVVIGQGTALAVAEGLGFAIASGLDATRVTEVLLKGSSRSWLLEHRSAAMISGDFRPNYPITMASKDLDNVLGEARLSGAPLPLTGLVRQLLAMLAMQGGQAEDLASIIRLYTTGGRA